MSVLEPVTTGFAADRAALTAVPRLTVLEEPAHLAAERLAAFEALARIANYPEPWAEEWRLERDLSHAVSLQRGDHANEVAALRAQAYETANAAYRLIHHDDAPATFGERLRANVRTLDQLRDLPALEPLIDGLLHRRSLNVVFGPPKSHKTFLMLDVALSLSTGSYWQRRAVTKTPVLYVVAEGQSGFADRVDAWLEHNRLFDPGEFRALTMPVNLFDAASVAELADVVAELNAGLVVIDTLARCIVGADENSAKDMGRVVAHVDHLRDATGAAIVLVHHQNRSGTNMRGSSALDGAADLAIAVNSEENIVSATVPWAKHVPAGATWRFSPIVVGDSIALGRPSSSDELPHGAVDMLTALAEAARLEPIASTTWLKACGDLVKERTFYRLKPRLIELEHVAVIKSGRTDRCHITATGLSYVEGPEALP